MSVRRTASVLIIAIALTLVPSPVRAHGIGGDAGDKSVLEFVSIGIEHMLLGWDHLLFIAGVLLVAAERRLAVKLISLFALGHSTTLILATLAGWRVDPEMVDAVVAVSVAFVGVVAVIGRPSSFRWFGAAVLGFGLVHGLGLATRFQDLEVAGGELARVIAFNVGVEIGQVTAILAIYVVAVLVDGIRGGERRRPTLVALSSTALLAAGVVASVMLGYAAFTDDGTTSDEPAAEDYSGTTGTCSVGDRTEPLPGLGDHAYKDFFEPDEKAPLEDFGHSVGDGFVAVLYPPTLEEPGLGELRAFVESPEGHGILAGAADQVGDKFVAVTSELQLTCDELDLVALEEFRTEWLDER